MRCDDPCANGRSSAIWFTGKDAHSMSARPMLLVSYVEYIRKTIWPADLAVLYPHAGMPPAWKIATALFLLVSISCLAFRKARDFPFLIVGWLWYLGTLVPVIGLVQVGSQSMADRYTYLPLVGIFIAVAWGTKEIVSRHPVWKSSIIVAFLFALSGLMPRSACAGRDLEKQHHPVRACAHGDKGQPRCPIQYRRPLSGEK